MKHYAMLFATTVAALMLLVFAQAEPQAQNIGAPQTLAGVRAAAGELGRLIDNAIGQADLATANRLRQLRVELTEVINSLADLEERIVKDANAVLDEPVRALHDLGRRLKDVTATTSASVAQSLNTGLIGVLVATDAIPLAKVEPYLAAIQPTRISPDAASRRVTVYGYFGKALEKYPLEAWVNGQKAPLSKAAGGYAFDLPSTMQLNEQWFVGIAIRYPVESGLIFRTVTYREASERLYVERVTPYSCDVKLFQPNPAFREQLSGGEVKYWAATQGGRGRPSMAETISADELFTQSVTAEQRKNYSAKTVKIEAVSVREEHNDVCEHATSTHDFGFTATQFRYSISAPSTGPHNHSGTRRECPLGICVDLPYIYVHGGGGGWRDIYVRPTFSADRTDVEPTVLGKRIEGIALRRNATHEVDLAVGADWTIHVQCQFVDGDEKFTAGPLVLTPQDAEKVSNHLVSKFSSSRLYVSTSH